MRQHKPGIAAGPAFMLGTGVFCVRYVLKYMHEDEARARRADK